MPELQVARRCPRILIASGATCVAAFCATTALCIAQDVPQSGRALYENGQFAEAAEAFKTQLAKGPPNSSLLYNLGNACFKAGRLGEAILYYERAARLAPRDRDIADNLALARLARVDRYIEPPHPWPLSVFVRVHRAATIREVATTGIALFWLLCLAIAARCLAVSPRFQRATGVAVAIVLALLLPVSMSLTAKYYDNTYVHRAIVVVEEAELRTGPGESFSSVVTLHEGAKLRIGQERGVWVQGTAQAGGVGWVRTGEIEPI